MLIKVEKIIAFFLIVVGVLLYFPVRDVWTAFPQGDMGRDLYVYERVLSGELPFRDFYWPYGPLMPYYYSAFFQFFGTNVLSLILGKIILNVFSGLIIYRILKTYIEPWFAGLACAWFWAFYPGFEHTFNHDGGLFCILFALMSLLQYVRKEKRKTLYALFVSLGGILLVKLNMGLFFLGSTIAVLVISRFSCKEKVLIFRQFEPREYLFLFICLAVVVLTYAYLICGIPQAEILQIFPITPSYDPFRDSLSESMAQLVSVFLCNFLGGVGIREPSAFKTIVAILLSSTISLFLIRGNREILLRNMGVFLILLIFLITAAHEFLLSTATYRLAWPFPVAIILIYFLLGMSLKRASLIIRLAIALFILVPILMQIQDRFAYRAAIEKSPQQFLHFEKIRIYTENPPRWKHVVAEAMDYLRLHITDSQGLFVIPYDPIFYYLLGAVSPVPELIFFDHIHISVNQEAKIVETLEKKKVAYVLISNRAYSTERGLGIFGQTYCFYLAQYIRSHYVLQKDIGDWNEPGGWICPYAIRIYKRVDK